jgi:putative membrane protein
MSSRGSRRPAAFRPEDIEFEEEPLPEPEIAIADELDELDAARAPALPVPVPPMRRRHRWAKLLAAGLGGLIVLSLGLAIDRLVRSLFERTDWLGWVGIALVAMIAVAVVALSAREILGLIRLRRITHIQTLGADAVASDDRATAIAAAKELIEVYKARPETARGRKALAAHLREIIDGRDLIGLAERELLIERDELARRIVLASAKRVSVVTAISPRALVDVVFVLVEILRLIRRLATLYGGRPGTLGFWTLARRSINHLAITGGMAAGESLIQQILGHGIAARISARLGEGVINGILTARVGIAAIDVCRPLPFVSVKSPRLSDIVGELMRKAERPEGEVSPG